MIRERRRAPIAEPRWGSAAARAAADLDRKTFNNWVSREPAVVLLSREERREAGERKRFSFDRRRHLQIAVTADLWRLGLPPRRAALAAAAFTDLSSAHPVDGGGFVYRNPGELYAGANTFLVVPPGVSDDVSLAKVVPVGPNTTVVELLAPEWGAAINEAIIVKLDPIVARVDAVLDRHQPDE